MAKKTKAQLEKENNELRAQLDKLDKKISKVVKSTKVESKTSLTFSETKWQTIAGQYGKQISLAPFVEGGKYPTPALNMRATFSATKSGLDEARALIDVAENNLEKNGLLTQ
tara:strand:- start:69 stop:404 length:336 start_codon:yes stop_codon:yes gene_type:complete